MRKVVWAFRARQDFIRITDYFASIEPSYPDRLLKLIDALALLLAMQPGLGSSIPGRRYRKMRVRGTDYILIYKATSRELAIARVRHAKEDWLPL